MNVLPLALSLSSTFTKIGAIAAFAALVGIAILSLLAFSQAREIKRLREWAGRAPERASELEQRVSAEAAVRAQRTAVPVAGARVVPRKTPLVSAPVSTAVHATAAAGLASTPAAGASPAQAPTNQVASAQQTPSVGGVSPTDSQLAPATPLPAAETPAAASAAVGGTEGEVGSGAPESAAASAVSPLPVAANGQPADASQAPTKTPEGGEIPSPAPATAAGQAAGVAARPPLPPSPAAPSPPGSPASSAIPAAGVSASAGTASPPRKAAAPPSPAVAATRSAPSRAVGAARDGVPPRAPSPSRANAAAGAPGAVSGRTPDARPGAGGPKYFKPQRSPARASAMIVGGVVVVVLVAVVAVLALKGGGSSAGPKQSSIPSTKTRPAASHTAVANPADMAVTVLNGTETNGLAHHLVGDLQQSGYARAEVSTAVPPGTHPTTVVQYTAGHRADGEAVAKTLDVSRVQTIEGTIASLARSATVVVVAGADQAAQLGGGGAQGKGEPAVGAGGTGEAVSGNPAGSGESAGAGESAAGESAAGSGN